MFTSLYPDLPVVPPTNVHNILFRRPEQKNWSNYTLHIDAITGKTRSYREFYEMVIDGATALGSPISEKGLGLNPKSGEMVGIMAENCMDYIALIHSCLAITTPCAMLSSYYTQFELSHALRLSKATRVFVQPKFLPLMQKAAKEVGLPDDHIYTLEGSVKGRRSFSDMINQVRKDFKSRIDIRPAGKDTLAYLVFSSGTSGLPKAVMISHGNIVSSLMQKVISKAEDAKIIDPPTFDTPEGLSVNLAFLPLHHTYGLQLFCFRMFLVRSTLVLLHKWDLDVALKIIPKYRITALFLIPSVVHQLVNSPKTKKADLSSVLFIGSGAAYLPDSLARQMSRMAPNLTFNTVSEGYGMSEATVSITLKPIVEGLLNGRAKNVPGSAGILLPGYEARLVRADGSEAGINEPGELWLRGPTVAMGYWNNEKANKETFVDRWLKTGDIFTIDQDGVFYFQDRAKDTLKVSGMQVSLVEIENTLLAHPDRLLVDATVAGVSGGRTSDEKVPRAWVVLSKSGKELGDAAVIKSLNSWMKKSLSKYKQLRGGIEIVDEIPKNPTGKVMRRVLQDEYEQRTKNPTAKL